MYSASNIVGEFVERSKKAEELGEGGGNGNGKHSVPDEKSDDGVLGDLAFFPGNFRMCKIGYDSSNGGSDKIGEPDKVIVLDDEIGQDCKESVVE